MYIKKVMNQLKSIEKKYFVVPLLFFVVLSMTVVCASFSQDMRITGDAYVRVNADIRITGVSIKQNSIQNEASQYADSQYSKNTATMYVTLPYVNSEITYNVTVENKSSERYTISNVVASSSNNLIGSNATSYVNEIIEPNSTKTVEITIDYLSQDVSDLKNSVITLNFTFSKPTASMLQYSSAYTDCENVQCALDELYGLLDD